LHEGIRHARKAAEVNKHGTSLQLALCNAAAVVFLNKMWQEMFQNDTLLFSVSGISWQNGHPKIQTRFYEAAKLRQCNIATYVKSRN
jgi:hypothetical protein